MKPVLIATDLSSASEPAITEGLTLARDLNTEAIIVHAWEPPAFVMLDVTVAMPPDQLSRHMGQLRERLDEITKNHSSEGLKVSSRLIEGPATDAILEEAASSGARMIVVGAVTHRALARLLGSTSDALVRSAPCPVLLVRAPAHD